MCMLCSAESVTCHHKCAARMSATDKLTLVAEWQIKPDAPLVEPGTGRKCSASVACCAAVSCIANGILRVSNHLYALEAHLESRYPNEDATGEEAECND